VKNTSHLIPVIKINHAKVSHISLYDITINRSSLCESASGFLEIKKGLVCAIDKRSLDDTEKIEITPSADSIIRSFDKSLEDNRKENVIHK
jgi:hypothetical protein